MSIILSIMVGMTGGLRMRYFAVTLSAVLVVLLIFSSNSALADQDPKFAAGLNFGYYDGYSFQGTFMVADFARNFPLAAEFGVGYSGVEPGSAPEARRIFINDATNGIPEKSGRVWDFRLDLMYPAKILSIERAFLFAGPRHTRFTGNFKYIGGNEDFDVRSEQWGLGAGVRTYFAMGTRVDLVLTAGFDYFFESTLTGHDTSYSPDGEHINPRRDYGWDEADGAIEQPGFEPRLLAGFSYRF